MNYSLVKGLGKAVLSMLVFFAALLITFKPELYNMSIIELLKSFIGTLTVGGAITLVINFLKVTQSK